MIATPVKRTKYAAIMAFIVGWVLVVYFPLAHMFWGADGLMNGVWNPKACNKLKALPGYDDALDAFGVHGVGGAMGALLTGLFASPEVNDNLNTNLAGVVGRTLWLEQLKAMGLTVVLSVSATAGLAYLVKAVMGLRPAPDAAEQGLDETDHGESGYHLDEGGYHGEEPVLPEPRPLPSLVKGPSS